VTGDAGLCSFAQPVLKRFGRQACKVVSGISSVQVAFARLGLDWLDARIFSAHAGNPNLDAGALAGCGKLAVLLGRKESLVWAAQLARQLGCDYRIFVCEDLTLKDERIRETTPAKLSALKVSSLALLLLVKKGLLA
jgi:cobalt-precorrin-7 (C5)-methyltransferase